MFSFRDYLSYAEKYLRLAEDELESSPDVGWLLIPATVLAWAAIESFVNNRLSDYGSLPEDLFELHERAFLLEKRIRFVDRGNKIGQFILEGTEYRRLEEKIFFLIAKFSSQGGQNIREEGLWQDFRRFKEDRDALVHPRWDKDVSLDIGRVRNHIETSKRVIQLVSRHIWDKEVDF